MIDFKPSLQALLSLLSHPGHISNRNILEVILLKISDSDIYSFLFIRI